MEKDVFNHIVSSYVLMESKILFTQEIRVQTLTCRHQHCHHFIVTVLDANVADIMPPENDIHCLIDA